MAVPTPLKFSFGNHHWAREMRGEESSGEAGNSLGEGTQIRTADE